MKREMSLSEFKEFCGGRDEIRYIFGFGVESSSQFSKIKVEFDKIAVCIESQSVRLSTNSSSIKFKQVKKAICTKDLFGNIEAELICYRSDPSHFEKFRIFFPASKNSA